MSAPRRGQSPRAANRHFWVYARTRGCIDSTSNLDNRNFRPYPENADEIFKSM